MFQLGTEECTGVSQEKDKHILGVKRAGGQIKCLVAQKSQLTSDMWCTVGTEG